ncbi:hypothetical protein NE237_006423 [Protea cynaroides]|uniref:Uncharacterized protein n=1 Tax=Protea cynaroides TaxID=273540 RepID=A0A9Q0KMK0_9MAGN|nr:hypothetical protein NE237_006423 [Protea cynaroides]
MNIVASPTILITLFLFLPSFLFFKFFLFIVRSIFPENVAGMVTLITGASCGIGEQLAYQYAKRGAWLVLVARRENGLQQVAETARELGSLDVLTVRADVSKLEDCKRFIDEALDHFGRTSVCMFEDLIDIAVLTRGGYKLLGVGLHNPFRSSSPQKEQRKDH